MKWLVIFLGALLLFSCNAEKRTQRYLFEHPEFTAGVCAEQFPDKPDSVIVKTDTLVEIIFMDSLIKDTDTLYRDSLGFKYRTITKVVTKTIRKDSIIYRENRAEQERLQLALLECQKTQAVLVEKNTVLEEDRNSWKGKAKTRWWWLALLIGGAVGFAVLKVATKLKKPIA